MAEKEDGNIVYVARHGATNLNQESGTSVDKIRGHIDVPLSEIGIKEAKEDGKKLKGKGIKAIFSSDLQRASDTAKIIGKAIGVDKIEKFEGLRPWNLGFTIQGKSSEAVQPKIEYYIRHPDEKPPGGETFNTFKGNFFNTFFNIIRANKDRNILIVTHYRCFKLLESNKDKGNIDVEKFIKRSGDNTGSIKIWKNGKFV